jgi:hypothetical protein
MRECLRIEAETDAALLGELQGERWEGEALSERDGKRRAILLATWFIRGVCLNDRESIVTPGSAPRLLGVRFRAKRRQPPRRQPAQPGAVAKEPLLPSGEPEIRLVLDELHDEAVIAAGYKPPTLREAGQRGKRLLAERGRYATATWVARRAMWTTV